MKTTHQEISLRQIKVDIQIMFMKQTNTKRESNQMELATGNELD